jgi:hypothetical protein
MRDEGSRGGMGEREDGAVVTGGTPDRSGFMRFMSLYINNFLLVFKLYLVEC